MRFVVELHEPGTVEYDTCWAVDWGSGPVPFADAHALTGAEKEALRTAREPARKLGAVLEDWAAEQGKALKVTLDRTGGGPCSSRSSAGA